MYVITFLAFAAAAFAEQFTKPSRRTLMLMWVGLLVWMIFHDGLRWETGTDWTPYLDFFSKSNIIVESDFEVGYVWLNRFVNFFTDEYSILLVVFATIQYVIVFRAIKRNSSLPFVSFFLYYCITLPLLGMNRQFLAICICLITYRYVVERRLVPFLLCIGCALLFHRSAIFFVPAYFLSKQWNSKVVIGLFVGVVMISLSGIINRLPLELFFFLGSGTEHRITVYTSGVAEGASIVSASIAILRRSIWLVLLLFCHKNSKSRNKFYNFVFNLYFTGLLFYILFNGTILQIVVSRGLLYYNIAEIFLVPYVIYLFKFKSRFILYGAIILYGYLNLNKGLNSYIKPGQDDIFIPYKGLLINSSYQRTMH